MINVVFLLLVFFMVAGIVRVSDPLPLNAPESTGDKPTVARSVLFVAGDGTLMLNDNPVFLVSLDATLSRLKVMPVANEPDTPIASRVPGNIAMRKPQDRPFLAIKADARVTVSLLRDIMHAARKAGLTRVELITLWIPAAVR